MSSTTNLALNQPAYNSSAWDVPLNNNETILDNQLAGTTSIALTGSNVTLTSPNTSGTGQTQSMRIVLTGTLSANVQVIIPSGISGKWIIYNTTSGAYSVTIASGGGGSTVVAPQGYNINIYSDGTNVLSDNDGLLQNVTLSSLTVSGTATFNGVSAFNAASTFSATTTLNGSASTIAAVLKNAAEPVTVSATASTGTINFDLLTQSILYYTTNASSNWTLNIRGSSSTALNTILSTGQTITLVFMATQGATAYYASTIQIDGSTVTPKWQGGSAPTAGNASSIDVYTFTIVKTGSSAYTVLASQSQFA